MSLRPCGLMDKALPSGGRDCGFESRLGLSQGNRHLFCPLVVVFCVQLAVWQAPNRKKTAIRRKTKKRGDARIELATSCTLSKNHTTRPITHIYGADDCVSSRTGRSFSSFLSIQSGTREGASPPTCSTGRLSSVR